MRGPHEHRTLRCPPNVRQMPAFCPPFVRQLRAGGFEQVIGVDLGLGFAGAKAVL